jgi:eukaryotic-like serine/threonine-protein kinase
MTVQNFCLRLRRLETRTLSHCVRHGVVHRGLKPGNIMLTRPGAKLLDFRLAKVTRPLGHDVGSDISTVAKMETGVVLYEMATGVRPFEGSTSTAIFDAILHQVPTSALQLSPGLPVELHRIINETLEKDHELCYQTASGLCAELICLKRKRDSDRPAARNLGKRPKGF